MALERLLFTLRTHMITSLAGSVLSLGACGSNSNSCSVDKECPGDLVCENHLCVSGSSVSTEVKNDAGGGDMLFFDENTRKTGSKSAVSEQSVGGIVQKSGNTNELGEIYFTDEQTGDPVTIVVKDKNTGEKINNAGVTFLDGKGFELFQVYKQGYVPALGVYAHNSEHEIDLVNENYNSLTIFSYYFDKNPQEYNALEKYEAWAGNNYLYVRCSTKEEMKKGQEWYAKGLSYFFSYYLGGVDASKVWGALSFVLEKLGAAEKLELYDNFPDEVYHIYQAANFTGPVYLKGAKMSKEICNDGIDNDCDKFIDGKDSDCKTTSTCTSHYITICNNNNVQWKDSCGKLEEVMKQCSTTQLCENSQCVEKKPTCTPQSTKICYNGDVYWQDSCGKMEGMVQSCLSNQMCQNGQCVDTSQFIDLGNGTIQDTKTGNIWQKDSPTLKFNIDDADSYCNSLNLGGSSNWVLPYMSELKSISSAYTNFQGQSKTSCGFPGVFNASCGLYWSGENCVSAPGTYGSLPFISSGSIAVNCQDPTVQNRILCIKN